MGKYRVSYGSRAFAQDANSAMKGDIVRGLIELITNCDDAYGEDPSGKIRVEVEHRPGKVWQVTVRDRARGMRKGKMEQAIGSLGLRISGFHEGEAVRGNLGRGAKDLAAFGPVTFESICGGYYARIVLEEDGTYDEVIERKSTPEDRERLGTSRGSGTSVTVLVADRFRCPRHQSLLERLSTHYQLRDINSDPRREITLVDLLNGRSDGVRYGRPSLPEVLTAELNIDGYTQATANLTVYRNEERFENPSSDPGRPEGLLLKGRRAVYENTLFSLESNPHAHWFSGTLSCPYIDLLAQEYDQRWAAREEQDPSNPIPIIARSRDGLERDHPFYRALAAVVEGELKPLVEAEERDAREGASRESARMRRTLDALGRDLARLIDSDLREIDEDGLGGKDGQDKEELIRVIPESPVLYMGENKTISVVVWKLLGEDEFRVEPDPEGVVELLDGPSISLSQHPRRPEFLIGRVRLRPLIEDEETVLSVRCGSIETAALVEVRPEREEPEPQPPTELQFERERYRMSLAKRRKVRVLAPVEVVDDHGQALVVSSSSPDIVVTGGLWQLEFDEDLVCYAAEVDVDPRVLGAKAKLIATVGSLKAECEVIVSHDAAQAPGLVIKISDETGGKYRALVERDADRIIVKVLGGHPAIKRYLGPGPEFPLQESLGARLTIAEVVAGEAARIVIEKKYPSAGELDGPAFYSEHMSYLTKYLARCHRMMVADTDLGS